MQLNKLACVNILFDIVPCFATSWMSVYWNYQHHYRYKSQITHSDTLLLESGVWLLNIIYTLTRFCQLRWFAKSATLDMLAFTITEISCHNYLCSVINARYWVLILNSFVVPLILACELFRETRLWCTHHCELPFQEYCARNDNIYTAGCRRVPAGQCTASTWLLSWLCNILVVLCHCWFPVFTS